MSYLAINSCFCIDEDTLTAPSATKDPTLCLGDVKEFVDSSSPVSIKKFMYVKSHDSLTQYQPYMVEFSNVSGSEVITAAPAVLASSGTIVVPQVAFGSGYYGWVQIFGECIAALDNETHVAGDFLQIKDAGVALLVDGTSGATAYTAASIAVMKGTLTGAGSATVFLFGGLRTSPIIAAL
jgi:hypothetical protein